MKGKNTFTASEIITIKKIVDEKNMASPDKQKGIRQKIRNLEFYYTDFPSPHSGYTSRGIDELIRIGHIKVIGSNYAVQSNNSAEQGLTIKSEKKSSRQNRASEEFELTYKIMDELKSNGFMGFKKMSELFNDCSCIPKVRGIYFVLYLEKSAPEFLDVGTGGYFKAKDPNISIEELKTNWVDDTIVIYIGKAGGEGGNATLNSRLRQYLRFGKGSPAGHYGGRLIWQIKGSKDLVVCWKELPEDDPDSIETKMISSFKSLFGKRPFANLAK